MKGVRAALKAAFAVALVAASCGTDANGVDDCRNIENALCEAEAPCGVIHDVAACKLFYRDQCLHGLPVDSPGGAIVDACVAAINDAGDRASAADSKASLAAVCQEIAHPEELGACSFLTSTPVSEGGSGGGGQAGAANTAGAAGTAAGGTAAAGARGTAAAGSAGVGGSAGSG